MVERFPLSILDAQRYEEVSLLGSRQASQNHSFSSSLEEFVQPQHRYRARSNKIPRSELYLCLFAFLVIVLLVSSVLYGCLHWDALMQSLAIARGEPPSSVPIFSTHLESIASIQQALASQCSAALLIKTGMTVATQRLSGHFAADLHHSTIPRWQIYSDAEQDIEGHHIVDVITDVANTDQGRKSSKLAPYRKQTERLMEGLPALAGSDKWDIDVFKNIPMDLDAAQRFPDVDWYIHGDADTYIVQSNLLKYLSHLDSSAHHFLGATSYVNGVPFAHGGSGYVISRGLMREAFVTQRDAMVRQSIEGPAHEAFGDFLIAISLYGLEGVDISSPEKNTTLSFTGELPQNIRYESRRICKPVFSMHHVVDADLDNKLWLFEQTLLQKKGLSEMITFADLFWYFASEPLRRGVEGRDQSLQVVAWDNSSNQDEEKGVETAEGCAAVCDEHSDCIGWTLRPNDDGSPRCYRQPNMRIGAAASSTATVSGWRLDRFRRIWSRKGC